MKRKIFTLLAAFLALAAFHANAQGGTGITGPYFLNVRDYDVTNQVIPTWYPFDVTTAANPGVTGVISVNEDDGKFYYKHAAGEFGNFNDYWSAEEQRVSGQVTKRYKFYNYALTACPGGRERVLLEVNKVNVWELVRFSAVTGNPMTTSYTPEEGGYLSAPNSMAAFEEGRNVLVRVRQFVGGNWEETGELRVVNMVDFAAGGPLNGKLNTELAPIWIQTEGITGRWAQSKDFKSLPDFIQIKDFECNVLKVKASNGKLYDKFKIAYTGRYFWNINNNFSRDPLFNGATTKNPTVGSQALDADSAMHLFSFVSPENASNLITVAQGRNVYGVQGPVNNNVFGDSLYLEPATDTLAGIAGGAADQAAWKKFRSQQFAIWMESDGSMSLYPAAAYTYTFGDPQSAQYVENASLKYNAPNIPSGYFAWGTNTYSEQAFRIGRTIPKYFSSYVASPSVYDIDRDYLAESYKFYFFDITAYNQIPSKRYFYLETKTLGRNNKPLVIDLVKQTTSLGETKLKLVLTDREENRFVSNGTTDTIYFKTPYDSLNMSACWSIKAIYNTDCLPTIPPAKKRIVGYVFENEEGNILAYNYDDASWTGYTRDEYAAYLFDNARVLISGGEFTSDVWKTLSFKDNTTTDEFFLTNLRGFDVADLMDANGYLLNQKYVRPDSAFDAKLDTTNGTFNTSYISRYYYKGGTPTSGSTYDVDRRMSFYSSANGGSPYLYEGLSFSGVDQVVHRNLGVYGFENGENSYYNVFNSFGLELKIVPIHVNKDTTLAAHDSIYATGAYEWERYAVDSLWTYYNKKPGGYFIQEALGWNDVIKDSHLDNPIVNLGRLAYIGQPILGDSLGIERVTYDDVNPLSSIDRDEFAQDSCYKWYYIYSMHNGKKTYMRYDLVRPDQSPDRKYGFNFKATSKYDATKFRFYQPLVRDKELQYFIIETRVPEKRYSDAGVATVATGFDNPGSVQYALISSQSRELLVTADPTIATRWVFKLYKEISQCRIDYIDNEFLADSKMYGAPLTAERLKERNAARTGSGRFITNGTSYGPIEEYPSTEVKKQKVTFTLVPAQKIVPNTTGVLPYYGELTGNYYYSNNSERFYFNDETRPVQLYYVRKIDENNDTTYMTVTNKNIYSQGLTGQSDPSVSGDMLKFTHMGKFGQVKHGANWYTNDSTLLQMFAVYGKLGYTEEDRLQTPQKPEPCIYPIDPESFGQFVFVPAAAYVFNYKTQQTEQLIRNTMIGDGENANEFRVGAAGNGLDILDEQLVVAPAKTSNTPGVPASEYIFKYQLYNKPFECVNFVKGPGSLDYYTSNSRRADYAHDYADPSSQWQLQDTATADGYPFYKFKQPWRKLQKRNQEPVTRTQLADEYYLFLIDSTRTVYNGYDRRFNAVKKLVKDPITGYNFGLFTDDVNHIEVIEITNKYPGELRKTSIFKENVVAGETIRDYNGDSSIDYFFKFSDGEVLDASWKIVESILADRFVWSRDYQNPKEGIMEPYAQNISPDRPVEYLQLMKSWIDTIAVCKGGPVLHAIPYYNIVYTLSTGQKYYLEAANDGTIRFIQPTTTELKTLATNPKALSKFNFCFPYRLTDAYHIMFQTEDKDSDLYWKQNVFIQSQVLAGTTNSVSIIKVNGKSANLEGNIKPSLYNLNYITPTLEDLKDFDATSWFFGNKNTSDDVWIRLADVPKPEIGGWVRTIERNEGSDYYVAATTDADQGIKYAKLTSRTQQDVSTTKLTFEFIDSTVLGSYAPKRIWYYRIKNAEGLYLTSAGFEPGTTKPGNEYIWPGNGNDPNGEGYAYFGPKLAGKDLEYRQSFGLKWIKPAQGEEDKYHFWVVAGVDSTKDNSEISKYYYLAQNNSRLIFRYGGGTTKQETEKSAMQFEFGVSTSDKFTDIDNPDNASISIYGIEDAVTVQNAKGKVELYTLDGRLIKSVNISDAIQTIPAPKGVVIVKNGSHVAKVVVK